MRDSLQASYFDRQPEVEKRALEIMQRDRTAAIDLLTDYGCGVGDQMVRRWRQMAYHMIVKYNDGVIRQEENGEYLRNSSGFRPRLTRPGMSDKVRRRIHQSTGTRFYGFKIGEGQSNWDQYFDKIYEIHYRPPRLY